MEPSIKVALNALSLSTAINLDPSGATWSASYSLGIAKLKFSYPSSTFELSFSPKVNSFDKIFKVQTEATYTLKGNFKINTGVPELKPVGSPTTESLPQWVRALGGVVAVGALGGVAILLLPVSLPASTATVLVALAAQLGLNIRFGSPTDQSNQNLV